MAKYNEVLRPRPGLLVIRQTRFEPTLKTLAGLGILGMFAWFADINPLTSLRFLEGLAWLVTVAVMSFIIDFRFGTISFWNFANYSTSRTPF